MVQAKGYCKYDRHRYFCNHVAMTRTEVNYFSGLISCWSSLNRQTAPRPSVRSRALTTEIHLRWPNPKLVASSSPNPTSYMSFYWESQEALPHYLDPLQPSHARYFLEFPKRIPVCSIVGSVQPRQFSSIRKLIALRKPVDRNWLVVSTSFFGLELKNRRATDVVKYDFTVSPQDPHFVLLGFFYGWDIVASCSASYLNPYCPRCYSILL